MANPTHVACAILKVGIWNGSESDGCRGLLYRSLLQSALHHHLQGGTVWGTVEGSRAARTFRTVESEVISNELPVWLEFVDTLARLEQWVPVCRQKLGNRGVMAMESGAVWPPARLTVKEGPLVKVDTRVDGKPAQPARQTTPPDDGLQVQVFTLEGNQIKGKPVYQAVAELVRKRGVLWISTTRGISGFGELRRMHRPTWWFRRTDIPIVMTILDRASSLEPILEELVEFVGDEGFLVSKPVDWHHPQ